MLVAPQSQSGGKLQRKQTVSSLIATMRISIMLLFAIRNESP
jgi:hypothetical protein